MKQVTIYTDGSCLGNGKANACGGWAAILTYCDRKSQVHRKEYCGGKVGTTNNRMELTSVIEAIRRLKEPCEITLTSDSKYVIDGLSKGWASSWRARGWKKSDGSKALNPDLWDELLNLCERHTISYVWVKGHAGHPYNERCDEMAQAESGKYE